MDLLVVGTASFVEVVRALSAAQERVRRETNPVVYPPDEFRSKLAAGHHFLRTVLAGPKVFAMGTRHELGNLVDQSLGHSTPTTPTRDRGSAGRRRRDLADSPWFGWLSPDGRLAIAYNAALQIGTAALAAAGYRAAREQHHYRVIQSLAFTSNTAPHVVAALRAFRKRRNVADYERAGTVSHAEADETSSWPDDCMPTCKPGSRRSTLPCLPKGA